VRHRATLIAVCCALVSLVFGSLWLRAQRNDTRALSSLVPAGAMFYLEAKDFSHLLNQWNSSEERRRWLKSDNASVLSESRLLQRLIQSQVQYATVAGVPVEMSLVNELAGSQSAFALYDFSTVHFVYLTRLAGAQLDQSNLWKVRGSYQTRDVAGIPFYVKTATQGRDSFTVTFASHDGWLVIATEPSLIARTLVLLASQPEASIAGDTWFADTVKQLPQAGDVRLVYNLTALRKTPQFRTYWIQRNITELGAYTSGSADLFEQESGFEEQRVLLRSSRAQSSAETQSLTQVLNHIPQESSLYRAWSTPTRELVRSALRQVVLGESADAPNLSRYAPQVSAEEPEIGSESDLETRIDEPEFHKSAAGRVDDLTDAVMAMGPLALLHSQSTRVADDRVFVLPESEVSLVCAKPDLSALQGVLERAVDMTKTGALDPLRTARESNTLVVSRMPQHAFDKAPVVLPGETYVAGYDQVAEWPRYKRLFGIVDRSVPGAPGFTGFFSANLHSLGDSLNRLRRASLLTQDEGMVTRDTVRYEFLTR